MVFVIDNVSARAHDLGRAMDDWEICDSFLTLRVTPMSLDRRHVPREGGDRAREQRQARGRVDDDAAEDAHRDHMLERGRSRPRVGGQLGRARGHGLGDAESHEALREGCRVDLHGREVVVVLHVLGDEVADIAQAGDELAVGLRLQEELVQLEGVACRRTAQGSDGEHPLAVWMAGCLHGYVFGLRAALPPPEEQEGGGES